MSSSFWSNPSIHGHFWCLKWHLVQVMIATCTTPSPSSQLDSDLSWDLKFFFGCDFSHEFCAGLSAGPDWGAEIPLWDGFIANAALQSALTQLGLSRSKRGSPTWRVAGLSEPGSSCDEASEDFNATITKLCPLSIPGQLTGSHGGLFVQLTPQRMIFSEKYGWQCCGRF